MRRLIAAALMLVVTAAGCGGGSKHADAKATTKTSASSAKFEAPIIPQVQQAPEIALRNQFGKPFKLSSLRGNAVALTFVYTHCPDVCPLIMQTLGGAKRTLGSAGNHFDIVAVSVDPKGDTPAYVRHFLAVRGLLHKVNYLLGTRKQLAPVWRAYSVATQPTDGSDVGHSAFIFGVDATGKIQTLYPASPLDPKAIVHDARILMKV
jgi:protein SCO1/2